VSDSFSLLYGEKFVISPAKYFILRVLQRSCSAPGLSHLVCILSTPNRSTSGSCFPDPSQSETPGKSTGAATAGTQAGTSTDSGTKPVPLSLRQISLAVSKLRLLHTNQASTSAGSVHSETGSYLQPDSTGVANVCLANLIEELLVWAVGSHNIGAVIQYCMGV